MKMKEAHLQWERESERRRVRREELEKELQRQVVTKNGEIMKRKLHQKYQKYPKVSPRIQRILIRCRC